MTEFLYLTSADVRDLATPVDYVQAVANGYRERGTGAPAEPRTRLDSADPPGFLTGYYAMLPEMGAMGGYTYTAGFTSRDAHFLLPLYDAESGEPLALLDGASMNPYKTGATGAVAVDALAREDASRVAIIGSGTQARGQLRAISTVRDLDAVSVFSPTEEHREQFAREMGDTIDAAIEAVPSSEAALTDADIVVTATTAAEPVFDGDRLEPGTHVTAMGQYHPEKREIDATTVARSTYVIDLYGRLERDAGAYMRALKDGAIQADHVHGELGSVLVGDCPGRQSPEDITVFDSGGTGIETVAAGMMLYERADEAGVGSTLSLSPASEVF